jgi:hypothetical protein
MGLFSLDAAGCGNIYFGDTRSVEFFALRPGHFYGFKIDKSG